MIGYIIICQSQERRWVADWIDSHSVNRSAVICMSGVMGGQLSTDPASTVTPTVANFGRSATVASPSGELMVACICFSVGK